MARKTLNTSRWKRLRNFVMARDGYRCQESLRFGKSVPAEMVHHIYPVREYPELEFVSWNLVALSNLQHNKMHNRTSDEITKKGKEWQKRKKENLKDFMDTPLPFNKNF